jgi:hypothetical protein
VAAARHAHRLCKGNYLGFQVDAFLFAPNRYAFLGTVQELE